LTILWIPLTFLMTPPIPNLLDAHKPNVITMNKIL
jgi:hypothetical protein